MQNQRSRTPSRSLIRRLGLIGAVLLFVILRLSFDSERQQAERPEQPSTPTVELQNDDTAIPPLDTDHARRTTARNAEDQADKAATGAQANTATAELGALRPVGNDILESTAGLRYAPGSREGHRLKHVLLHTKDQPNRPGSHGVFHGGRQGALQVIDEAYQIAQQANRQSQKKQEGRRTIYTVDMKRVVGFVGGQTGQRQSHPEVTHVRLVLENVNVITAFPIDLPGGNW